MTNQRFTITEARWLAPDVKLIRIRAPRIAKKQRPGQFVIVQIGRASCRERV
jgi:NAD(P)H-flavin reductase